MTGRGGRIVLGALLALGAGRPAMAGMLTFPGPAPCDTTLAACISGATEGDVVQLATNGPIDESISIYGSLTLEPAPGFTPALAATRTVYVQLSDPARTVTLRGLTLANGGIRADANGTASHTITVTDCTVTQTSGSTGSTGIYVDFTSPGSVTLTGNHVVSDGYPLEVDTFTGTGTVAIDIERNFVKKATVGKSANGLYLDLRGSFAITADIRSNVISDTADCACGGATAFAVRQSDTAGATVNFVNNTIDLSPSTGIYVYPPAVGQVLVMNIYDNVVTRTGTALFLPAANPRLTVNDGFNDFFNNTGGPIFGGYGPAGPSTLAADPLYTSLPGRDYHPMAGSPLIDAGNDSPAGGLGALDVDGNVRIAGAHVDIGAYEFGSAPPTTTTTTTTLPGCTQQASYESVQCRLGDLGTSVQQGVPAGPLATQLGALVGKASNAVTSAEGASKPRARKHALSAAVRALGAFGKKLRSRKAKTLDAGMRTALGTAADAIRTDVKTLKTQ